MRDIAQITFNIFENPSVDAAITRSKRLSITSSKIRFLKM